MRKVESLQELKELASQEEGFEGFIWMNFGLRSSKSLRYDEQSDMWNVYNGIDDSEQVLTTKQLGKETNIIDALEKGALYLY